jgi:hypothetical protein
MGDYMQISGKWALAAGLVGLVSGASLSKYWTPGHTEEQHKTKEAVEAVVTRRVTKQKKDGTVTTVETTTQNRRVNESESSKVTTKAPDWRLSAGVGIDRGGNKVLQAELQRRVVGPLSAGVWVNGGANRDPVIGLSIGFEF